MSDYPTVPPPEPPPAPGYGAPLPPPAPLSPSDERTWAMLAHLSVLLNLVTGFLGVVAALLIYLIYKDRSRYVAYQALQAFLFQLTWWGGPGILTGLVWGIIGLLTPLGIGVLLTPVACVLTPIFMILPVLAPIYGTWAGIQASQGKDFKYWLIGDWTRGTLMN